MHPSSATRAALGLTLTAHTAMASCADDRQAGTPATTTDVPSLRASAEGLMVVAEVNGRPVFDSCVISQMSRSGVDREAALQECIDFELLAQTAERRGYADAPEAREVRKREAVRALIDREFLPTFDGPEDVPDSVVEAYWRKNRLHFDYPELRLVAHALVYIGPDVAQGSEADQAARQIAENLYTLMRNKRWDKDEFLAEARRFRAARLVSALYGGLEAAFRETARPSFDRIVEVLSSSVTDTELVIEAIPQGFPADTKRLAREFVKAAFAIPSEGMVSPPTRTAGFGWHVILLGKLLPERHDTFADAEPEIREELFPGERQLAFLRWQKSLAGDREVEVYESALARMVEAERARDPLSKLDEGR